MGRFNKYGTKLDMIVRGAIEEMEKAEKDTLKDKEFFYNNCILYFSLYHFDNYY